MHGPTLVEGQPCDTSRQPCWLAPPGHAAEERLIIDSIMPTILHIALPGEPCPSQIHKAQCTVLSNRRICRVLCLAMACIQRRDCEQQPC